MTEVPAQARAAWETPATPGQVAELGRLADLLGEDVPAGLRRNEAAQRIDEWRRHQLLSNPEIVLDDLEITHVAGGVRPVQDVVSPLL